MNQNETLGKILAVLERIATGIEDIKVQQVFGPAPRLIPDSERTMNGTIRDGMIYINGRWNPIDEYTASGLDPRNSLLYSSRSISDIKPELVETREKEWWRLSHPNGRSY